MRHALHVKNEHFIASRIFVAFFSYWHRFSKLGVRAPEFRGLHDRYYPGCSAAHNASLPPLRDEKIEIGKSGFCQSKCQNPIVNPIGTLRPLFRDFCKVHNLWRFDNYTVSSDGGSAFLTWPGDTRTKKIRTVSFVHVSSWLPIKLSIATLACLDKMSIRTSTEW